MQIKAKPSRGASVKSTSSTKAAAAGPGKSKSFSASAGKKSPSGKRAAMLCTTRAGFLTIAVFCSILAFQSIGKGNGLNLQERKLTESAASAARRMLNSTLEEGASIKHELLAEFRELKDWRKGGTREEATSKSVESDVAPELSASVVEEDTRRVMQASPRLAQEPPSREPEAFKQKLKQLVAQMEEESEEKAELAKEVEKHKGLQAELDATRAELANERAASGGLRADLDASKAELASEKEAGGGLRAELDATKAELAGERAAGGGLRAELDASKAELADEKAGGAALRARMKEMQDELAAARDGAQRAEDLLKQVERLKDEKRHLYAELAEGKGGASGTAGAADCDSGSTKDQLAQCQTAFARVTTEKANLEMKLATGAGWENVEVQKEAMTIARSTLAQCGKQTGGMVVQADVPVWKGYACQATDEELRQYFNYESRGLCPDDWIFVQDLIYTKNCFALPKRRCKNRTPPSYVDPVPFPQSLFDQGALRDENVRWDLHQCKSFACLNSRLVGDCRNCFNMSLERSRWKSNYRGGLRMADVIKMKGGTLRLGLDAGGGSGSFAAHMARFNVTVMTTAMNIETIWHRKGGLPYMETIALRGLIPLHVPHKARLPFYDNTLDVIHSVNSIKYLPILDFEELIFEWDRVLRPGGIIWFEMFYAPNVELPLYIATVDLLDYKKLYWNLTPKPDAGERADVPHTYLNAVIEKTARTESPTLTS